jgi:uncharacterized protein (TIGR03435 family)
LRGDRRGQHAAQSPAAQSPTVPDWQAVSGGKMSFEVASVKRGGFVPPSFPLDVGDALTDTGGRFIANFPLLQFIMFAYKFDPALEQREKWAGQIPDWARSSAERWTIEAKAPINNPTKDQFRLMMQSLLAERFNVAVHFETRQGPMLALTLVNPGKLGPKLRPHAEGPPCDAATASPPGGTDVFPTNCGGYSSRPAPNGMRMQAGSRNVTMAYFAQILTGTGAARLPVMDQTGLSGTFDFMIEHAPAGPLAAIIGVQPDRQGDPQGPTFLDAMHEQLGLKLEPTNGPFQILVIDRLERPTEN